MASLVLLVSELLKLQNSGLVCSTSIPFPLYTCGATSSTGVPCFVENRGAKVPGDTATDQFCDGEGDFEEDLDDLRVSVEDIVWP